MSNLALRLEDQFYNEVNINVDESDLKQFIANVVEFKDIDEALRASNLTHMDLLNLNKFASFRNLIDSIVCYLSDANAFLKIRAVSEAYRFAIESLKNGDKVAGSLASTLIKSDIKPVINITESVSMDSANIKNKNLSDIVGDK